MLILLLLATIRKAIQSNSGDELELIKRIRQRDPKALEELYDLYKQRLYGIIVSIVKQREEAEDALRETFVRIWNKADSFNENRGNVYRWIVTLARDNAIDLIRSKDDKTPQKKTESRQDPLSSTGTGQADPFKTTIFSDRAELVKKALLEIPKEQSEVIKIAYYRGMTQSEIADYLDIPIETVKKRSRLGMMKLQGILEEVISVDG